MAQPALSDVYDEHYFRTYRGAPYGRSEVWLDLFHGIADGIVREIHPGSVLDAGCAFGLLVEALRAKQVDAWGLDVSSYAINQVQEDVKPFCRTGSIVEPLRRQYDLITCFDVLEHLTASDASRAVESLCTATDDVLFTSATDNYGDDTSRNVQPIEYWTALFARHGFIRDVEFDGVAIGRPSAIRYRKSSEPLHRIVAGYDRKLAALTLENSALRARALDTKTLITQYEDQSRELATSTPDVAALEQTIAEQTQHLDALAERLEYMSDRESDLRSMLVDAHDQLLKRDELFGPLRLELDARGKVIDELQQALNERTDWAQRMVSEAEQRGAIIEQLQVEIHEKAALADSAVSEAEQRRALIDELQRVIDERTGWAERMVAEAEQRGAIIEQLQRAINNPADAGGAPIAAPGRRFRRLRGLARRLRYVLLGR